MHDVATGGGTLQELVTAINGSTADTGVKATAVRVADGSYRLIAESAKTGVASAFTLTKGDGTDLLGGADCARRSGRPDQHGPRRSRATSTTNTFTDIAPGVSITLAANATVGGPARSTVAQNPSSVAASISSLVDQLNSMFTNIDTSTAGKTSTTAAGVLSGDSTVRTLRTSSSGPSSATAPRRWRRTASRPTATASCLRLGRSSPRRTPRTRPASRPSSRPGDPETDGWVARVASVAKSASDAGPPAPSPPRSPATPATSTGSTKSIEDWDVRLELRRTSLERQYTALETALSNLQSQGSWLSGQISSLPTYS